VGASTRLGASQAIEALAYYVHAYPVIVEEARRWLVEALADV